MTYIWFEDKTIIEVSRKIWTWKNLHLLQQHLKLLSFQLQFTNKLVCTNFTNIPMTLQGVANLKTTSTKNLSILS
jgi:hypothetical protein